MEYQHPDNTQNYQQQYSSDTAPSTMPYPGPEQQGPPVEGQQSHYIYTDTYSQQQQQYFPTPIIPEAPSNQNNQLTSYNSPPETSYNNQYNPPPEPSYNNNNPYNPPP